MAGTDTPTLFDLVEQAFDEIARTMKLLPLSGHSGHDRTCY